MNSPLRKVTVQEYLFSRSVDFDCETHIKYKKIIKWKKNFLWRLYVKSKKTVETISNIYELTSSMLLSVDDQFAWGSGKIKID